MYCKKCGKELSEEYNFCDVCGTAVYEDTAEKETVNETANETTSKTAETTEECSSEPRYETAPEQKSRIFAAFLALVFGTIGMHDFYLGKTTPGYVKLALTLCSGLTCGLSLLASGIWALIDAINILSDKNAKDQYGVPLRG